jgi:hypothetical protein
MGADGEPRQYHWAVRPFGVTERTGPECCCMALMLHNEAATSLIASSCASVFVLCTAFLSRTPLCSVLLHPVLSCALLSGILPASADI